MSHKEAKKLRKYFRKEYMAEAHRLADQHMKILKTKPKLVPMFIWVFFLKIFIRIRE